MRISEKGMKKVREGGRERPFLLPLDNQIIDKISLYKNLYSDLV